jgi:hypothetical protein
MQATHSCNNRKEALLGAMKRRSRPRPRVRGRVIVLKQDAREGPGRWLLRSPRSVGALRGGRREHGEGINEDALKGVTSCSTPESSAASARILFVAKLGEIGAEESWTRMCCVREVMPRNGPSDGARQLHPLDATYGRFANPDLSAPHSARP